MDESSRLHAFLIQDGHPACLLNVCQRRRATAGPGPQVVQLGFLVFVLLSPLLPVIIAVESLVLVHEAWRYRKMEREGTLGEGDGFWSGRLDGLHAQRGTACLAGAVVAAIEGVLFGIVEGLSGAVLLFFLYMGGLVVMRGVIVILDRRES